MNILRWFRQFRCEHYSTLGSEVRIVAEGRFKERIRTCVKCQKQWPVWEPIWPGPVPPRVRGRPSDMPARPDLDRRSAPPPKPPPGRIAPPRRVPPPAPVAQPVDNSGDILIAGMVGYAIGSASREEATRTEPEPISGSGGGFGGAGASVSWDSGSSSSASDSSSSSSSSDSGSSSGSSE